MLNDFQVLFFHDFHHVVHGDVGESERQEPLLMAFDDFTGADGQARRLTVGAYQPRSAEFDAAEIAHHGDYHIGETEGVDLPQNGLSGGAAGLAVVARQVLAARGAYHVGPATVTRVVVFVGDALDGGAGLLSVLHGLGKSQETAHLFTVHAL